MQALPSSRYNLLFKEVPFVYLNFVMCFSAISIYFLIMTSSLSVTSFELFVKAATILLGDIYIKIDFCCATTSNCVMSEILFYPYFTLSSVSLTYKRPALSALPTTSLSPSALMHWIIAFPEYS